MGKQIPYLPRSYKIGKLEHSQNGKDDKDE